MELSVEFTHKISFLLNAFSSVERALIVAIPFIVSYIEAFLFASATAHFLINFLNVFAHSKTIKEEINTGMIEM